MRFAYLIMGEFDSSVDCAVIHTGVSRMQHFQIVSLIPVYSLRIY